jgi:hypothetical protein
MTVSDRESGEFFYVIPGCEDSVSDMYPTEGAARAALVSVLEICSLLGTEGFVARRLPVTSDADPGL